MKSPENDDRERRRRIELLRAYTRTMGERIASLRARTESPSVALALAEVLQELDVTHEELTVADEEIAGAEAHFEEARRGLEGRLRHYMALFEGAPDGYVLTDRAA
jgi:phenylacetate-coenzyme A ligase PaaK-like adenylate-forming protein